MKTQDLLNKTEAILERIEEILGNYQNRDELTTGTVAWIWSKSGGNGFLEAIDQSREDSLKDLCYLDRQKDRLKQNTLQFLAGYPANNALLWGPRGTGKSSLVRALLNEYSDRGLRMIEVQPRDMADIPTIMHRLGNVKGRFIIFCDDLTFENGETNYKILKTVMDGSIRTTKQFIVYATSNRRHIIPENASENLKSSVVNNELHHSEATEEKISLSERFGIWLSFHPFSQNNYLNIVFHHIKKLSTKPLSKEEQIEIKTEALQWALERGSKSGRVAYQFVIDWLGRKSLEKNE